MLKYFVIYQKSNIFNSNSLATSPPKLQHLHLLNIIHHVSEFCKSRSAKITPINILTDNQNIYAGELRAELRPRCI